MMNPIDANAVNEFLRAAPLSVRCWVGVWPAQDPPNKLGKAKRDPFHDFGHSTRVSESKRLRFREIAVVSELDRLQPGHREGNTPTDNMNLGMVAIRRDSTI
jgi:hypothetical protein